jgi:hypothetical protein
MGLGDLFFDRMHKLMHDLRDHKKEMYDDNEFWPEMDRLIFELIMAFRRCMIEADTAGLPIKKDNKYWESQRKAVLEQLREEVELTDDAVRALERPLFGNPLEFFEFIAKN